MGNKIDTSIVYSEVYNILKCMNKSDVKRIPLKCLELIHNKKSESYNPQYDLKKPLNEQNVKQETLAMLALLYLNYWCDSEEEKKELIKQFNENEKKCQENLNERYTVKNLFNNKPLEEHKESYEQVTLTVYKKSIFQKILNKFKKWIKLK